MTGGVAGRTAAGSPVDAWQHEGKTYGGPAEQAAFSGNVPVLARLIELGASPQGALSHGLHSGDAETLDVLGRFPLDVEASGDPKLGSTLLHEEIRWGRLKNALWLIRKGADPNRPHGRGWTAAHYAASRGVSAAWLEELQSLGADLTSVDAQGQTPLDVAESKGKKKLAVWLREL